ncbi:MAG: chemotaxis protein CheW [Planctomycetaceae bacterium]|nr:chemotaxis protein CheW [Planctomycetaceae bacterium]
MFVLMCQAGAIRFALDASRVLEVLPYVHCQPVAEAPRWLVGAFACRGRSVPLADLTCLLTGQAAAIRWNSRILLWQPNTGAFAGPIGLIAERVTTAEIDPQKLAAESGSAHDSAGPVLLDERGMFQLVDPDRLLVKQGVEAPVRADA